MGYENQTAITVRKETRDLLEEYKDCSWEEFFERVLILIRQDAEEDIAKEP